MDTSALLKSKKNLVLAIAAAVLIVLLFVIYWFFWPIWQKAQKPGASQNSNPLQSGAVQTTDDINTKINSLTNPLDKKPDLNPVNKINPFSGIYKNPFK